MSYQPTTSAAAAALAALTRTPDGIPDRIAALGSPYRDVDHAALRDLLITLACPSVCVGVVDRNGWHELCEKKADAALEALAIL